MFEHEPKRHSYQLWEVKFQCPQTSAFRRNWPAIFYPAGYHPPPPTAKEYSNLRLVPDRPTFPLSFSIFVPVSLSAVGILSSLLFSVLSSVQIKLIFKQRTLFSYEFYRSLVTHGMEMFSHPTTRSLGSRSKIRSKGH